MYQKYLHRLLMYFDLEIIKQKKKTKTLRINFTCNKQLYIVSDISKAIPAQLGFISFYAKQKKNSPNRLFDPTVWRCREYRMCWFLLLIWLSN